MSVADGYILVISTYFGLYAVACSVKCASSLELLGHSGPVKAIFSPLWEASNVFLVLGLIAMAVAFQKAWQPLGHALLGTLAGAFIALLASIGLGLALSRSDGASQALKRLFVLFSFAAPLSFAAAGIYLVTGRYFWQSPAGWMLIIATTLGLPTVGWMLLSRVRKTAGPPLLEQAYLLWLVMLGSALPFAIKHSSSLLQTAPLQLITLASLLSICLVFLKYAYGLRRTWLLGPLLFLAVPILLAWANRPYIISGQLALSQAYQAHTYINLFLVFAGLTLLLTGVGTLAQITRSAR